MAMYLSKYLLFKIDLQSTVDSRQKLDGQRQENLSVQKVRRVVSL